jgi:hypothetical protein
LTTIFYELEIVIKESIPTYPSRVEGASIIPLIVKNKSAVLFMLNEAV